MADPILHREDPDKDPLVGHVKVTRQDWLNLARDVLVNEGVAEVKVLALSARLGVSRSSFYWYFENRDGLLQALLQDWETRNTSQITANCQRAASNITAAVCNFFRCFVDPAGFDQRLDFAIREWSRRDAGLRARVDAADATRLAAVRTMFEAHHYSPEDADARARILYFMQLGYHALEVRETAEARKAQLVPYLRGFTGQEPDPVALEAFRVFFDKLNL